MTNKTWIAIASATAMSLSFAGKAEAITFQGSASAEFGTPTPTTGVTFSGVGTNTFTTGAPFSSSDSPNIFEIEGLSYLTSEDVAFAIANLTYTNGVTSVGTNVDSVPIDLTLSFTTPEIFAETFTFSFNLDVTHNTTGDPVLDADTLTIVDVFSTTIFEIAGESFTLELLGFSSDGGVTIENQFTLPEDAMTESQLFAKISAPSQEVPEPSGLLGLLSLGVLSSGSALKRKLTRSSLSR